MASPKKTSAAKPAPNNADMKTSEIRDLIEFIAQTGLNEVDIETKELKIHVKREPDQKVVNAAAPVMAAAPVVSHVAAPAAAPAAPKAEKPRKDENLRRTVHRAARGGRA